MTYQHLDASKIVETAHALAHRIEERFPGAGLASVAHEVVRTAEAASGRAAAIARPNVPLRALRVLLIVFLVVIVGASLMTLHPLNELSHWSGIKELISILEPTLGTGVFIGAFVLFVWSLEDRHKQRHALAALHELRSLAHVIDMHQLTKDPQHELYTTTDTASSPLRTMSAYELNRYFDYCAELLALVSKVAALYAQSLNDPTALAGVDQIETLCTGLSQKVWQKLSMLPRVQTEQIETAANAVTDTSP